MGAGVLSPPEPPHFNCWLTVCIFFEQMKSTNEKRMRGDTSSGVTLPVLTCIVAEPEHLRPGDTTGNVQKKLISWRSLLPDDVTDDQSQTRRAVGDLVVVASLVDRLPNLGGE